MNKTHYDVRDRINQKNIGLKLDNLSEALDWATLTEHYNKLNDIYEPNSYTPIQITTQGIGEDGLAVTSEIVLQWNIGLDGWVDPREMVKI